MNLYPVDLESTASSRAVIAFDQLPYPTVIESLNFEDVLLELKADLLAFFPPAQREALEATLMLESEPLTKLLQAFAYRIVQERQRANEKARRLLLAYATGAELDHLGALPWVRTPRKVIVEADPSAIPPILEQLETDDDYRNRIQLALEGWSTAGPAGAYMYHALRADARVKDVSVVAPRFTQVAVPDAVAAQLPADSYLIKCDNIAGEGYVPGHVVLALLGATADGTLPVETLTKVQSYLQSETLRPLSDIPLCIQATIKPYRVVATLFFYPGPDRTIVLNNARAAALEHTAKLHRCGHDVSISGLHKALHAVGVQRVVLTEPAAHIACGWNEAPYCIEIVISDGGVDV
jgi:phage-related baseplate assembly protein